MLNTYSNVDLVTRGGTHGTGWSGRPHRLPPSRTGHAPGYRHEVRLSLVDIYIHNRLVASD
jgi:hypothetical protein